MTQTEKIGFIGLGIMGQPMSGHLLAAGYEVSVFDLRRESMEIAAEHGAVPCSSPAEVASLSDIIITMVPDSEDVAEAISGEGGVSSGVHPGSVVIDMSTIDPATGQKQADLLRELGVGMLDAPVTGGAIGAQNASLSIFVGGEPETFARCRPMLDVLGASVMYMGTGGMGHTAKLANQILGATAMMGIAEAFVLAKKAGLDLEAFYDATTQGSGDSWHLRTLGPKIIAGDFAPGFMAKHMRKDMRLAAQTATTLDSPVPVTAIIGQMYGALAAAGLGDEGHHALIKVIEQMADSEARG
jgi:3-hydroxyisobutyrate dehydrogenase